jgi:hypothetical protein
MKKNFIYFIYFLSISSFAQFSKTHYIPPLSGSNFKPLRTVLYISTPSITPVNFKINQLGGQSFWELSHKVVHIYLMLDLELTLNNFM